jgi:hypothetical protein
VFPTDTSSPPPAAPASEPIANPPVAPAPDDTGAEAADRPRRTGWWAKRLLGGKG